MKIKRFDGDVTEEDRERWEDVPLVHVCEACGRTEILAPEEAFEAGWDYPPRMGWFGIVSPRTCGDCNITQTAWWALTAEGKDTSELTDAQRATVTRIVNEPASILPIHISFPGIDDDIMSDALSRLEKEGGLGGRGGIQDL